jgi:hypothetical protein
MPEIRNSLIKIRKIIKKGINYLINKINKINENIKR